jgi:hypothetical protein
LRPYTRTSFHHQPEAQHPKSSAIHKSPADYPIFIPLATKERMQVYVGSVQKAVVRNCSKTNSLFDHLVGAGEERRRHGEVERLGRNQNKEHAMSQIAQAAIAVIGIDIGKSSYHVVGHDDRGAIVLRQKWSRSQVETHLANMPPCLVGMEACVGAHHLSRKLKALGHDARLMPAKYVRPYSKG